MAEAETEVVEVAEEATTSNNSSSTTKLECKAASTNSKLTRTPGVAVAECKGAGASKERTATRPSTMGAEVVVVAEDEEAVATGEAEAGIASSQVRALLAAQCLLCSLGFIPRDLIPKIDIGYVLLFSLPSFA